MITQDQLKNIFNYDQLTGIFTWKEKNSTGNKFRSSDRVIGRKCNCLDVHGYIQISAFGKV